MFLSSHKTNINIIIMQMMNLSWMKKITLNIYWLKNKLKIFSCHGVLKKSGIIISWCVYRMTWLCLQNDIESLGIDVLKSTEVEDINEVIVDEVFDVEVAAMMENNEIYDMVKVY